MKTIQFVEPADEQTKLDVLVEIGSVTIRPLPTQQKEPADLKSQPELA